MLNKLYLILISVFTWQTVFGQDVRIPWEPNYKLTWNDFKGTKVDSVNGLAATMAVIESDYDYIGDSLTISVYHNFLSNTSFIDSAAFITFEDSLPHLLEHEQIHFDISEVYARIMRKRLFDVTQANLLDSSQLVNSTILRVYDELDSVQDLFDHHTAHGIIRFRQSEWRIKVDSLMNEWQLYYQPNEYTPHNKR